jgi:hypothetical protein
MLRLTVYLEDGSSFDHEVPVNTVTYDEKEGVVQPSIVLDLEDVDAHELARWRDNEFVPDSGFEEVDVVYILDHYYKGARITLSPEEHTRLLASQSES